MPSVKRFGLREKPAPTVVRVGEITAEEIREKFNLPPHADIWVEVPGGADWCGAKLSLGVDVPHLEVRVEDRRDRP